MTEKTNRMAGFIVLGLLLAAVLGCRPPSTQPTVPPTPTPPPGWQTYIHDGQCGYVINHPSDMQGASQGEQSWILNTASTDPGGPFPNFVYISTIPDGFQSDEPGAIYNYDPVETQTLLSIQVGESRSLRDDPTLEPSFTYTRVPDATLGTQTVQAYENEQPWEFPPGTKETRYYLQAGGCTYLIGGYLSTVGSGQPGAIGEELFHEIIASFRLPR